MRLFDGAPVFNVMMIVLNIVMLAVFAPGLRKLKLREVALVSLMVAIASGGRALATAFPGVQPVSFIVMLAGISMGPSAGYVCGLLSGLLSDMLIMMGPQTLWYCLLWGLLGALSGGFKRPRLLLLAAVGFAWGFVWGWVMNLWWYTTGAVPFSIWLYFAACAASFPFDLAHAVTNAVLILSLGGGSMGLIARLLKHDKQG